MLQRKSKHILGSIVFFKRNHALMRQCGKM